MSTMTHARTRARDLKVSVVVISKDEPALAETLDALAGDVGSTVDDVVVVDASSGRLDAIRDANPWVTWIPYTRPPGAGITIPEQRNLGVAEAIGDVIVFTDCGCVPEPGWLAALLAPILDDGEHVTCGRTGSRSSSLYDGIPPGSTPEAPPDYVEECPTINMAFRRAVFVSIGGFDESFDYGSDIDFSWRLRKAGVRIRYVPEAVVVHEWGDPARQRRRAVQYGRARARLYRKHPDRLGQMVRNDPIVPAYPLFLLGLPLTLRWRWYPMLLAIPLWRNRGKQPVRVVVDHLWFATGVLRELASGPFRDRRRQRAQRRQPASRVLVLPRSSNPYQADLYGAMRELRPLDVRYVEGPTPSQTVNVALLPLILAVRRLQGFKVLHVHWIYTFALAWSRGPATRRVIEWWYRLVLRAASALDFKIVWTVHNLVPHEQVFVDDLVARRELVSRCDAVIAHNDTAGAVVRDWNAPEVIVVPPGISPVVDPMPRATACAAIGLDPAIARALFFGQIRDYKGVDLLVEAAASLPPDVALEVVVVGECDGEATRRRLDSMAAAITVPSRLRMCLDFVSESELARYLAAADFAVFPFRRVTSSSSVGHALAAGLPVVIPDLEALEEVPAGAAIRYDATSGVPALAAALTEAATKSASERAAMTATAGRFVAGRTWRGAAEATWLVLDDLFASEVGG